jgi:uncharacterized protein (DUF2141 family)
MSTLAKLLILIFVLSINPFNLFGQFTLTVTITGLENSKGQILLELKNDKEEKISGHTQTIENNKCIIYISNLKPGKYSFRYFHDENKNEELDTNWLGIPKEGFGFSNNAKGTFGPPSFKKTIFNLNGDTSQICTPTYY